MDPIGILSDAQICALLFLVIGMIFLLARHNSHTHLAVLQDVLSRMDKEKLSQVRMGHAKLYRDQPPAAYLANRFVYIWIWNLSGGHSVLFTLQGKMSEYRFTVMDGRLTKWETNDFVPATGRRFTAAEHRAAAKILKKIQGAANRSYPVIGASPAMR